MPSTARAAASFMPSKSPIIFSMAALIFSTADWKVLRMPSPAEAAAVLMPSQTPMPASFSPLKDSTVESHRACPSALMSFHPDVKLSLTEAAVSAPHAFISSQCVCISAATLAIMKTTPATAAATAAGAPRSTAPTAAIARPIASMAVVIKLDPFCHASTKADTARVAPPTDAPMPVNVVAALPWHAIKASLIPPDDATTSPATLINPFKPVTHFAIVATNSTAFTASIAVLIVTNAAATASRIFSRGFSCAMKSLRDMSPRMTLAMFCSCSAISFSALIKRSPAQCAIFSRKLSQSHSNAGRSFSMTAPRTSKTPASTSMIAGRASLIVHCPKGFRTRSQTELNTPLMTDTKPLTDSFSLSQASFSLERSSPDLKSAQTFFTFSRSFSSHPMPSPASSEAVPTSRIMSAASSALSATPLSMGL